MHFIIGTLNIPKSEAIEEVLKNSPYIHGDPKISKYKVNSGVSDMPLHLAEILNGAKNRAQRLRGLDSTGDFYIGMEGGVYKDYNDDKHWIMGVVYIENKKGEGHYGYSYHLEVPPKIVTILYSGKGEDLETIMYRLGAEQNIGDKGGSPSAWSDGTLVRKDEFIYATKAALAPFFNSYYQ